MIRNPCWKCEQRVDGRFAKAAIVFWIAFSFDCVSGAPRSFAAVPPPTIYWTDAGTGLIQRANLNGSNVETVIAALPHPEGVAVDLAGGRLYWAEDGQAIGRANLDGSGQEALVSSGLDDPIDIALDLDIGAMFWVDAGANRLQRANLDGTDVENLVTVGLNQPVGIALDRSAQKVFLSNLNLGNILRANYDGTGVQTIIDETLWILDVELDLTAGKLYWAAVDPNTFVGSIRRANLDGSNSEEIMRFDGTDGFDRPIGLAVDVRHGHLYWTDPRFDRIRRSNLDGSGIIDVVTGLDNPQFITVAIIPEPGSIAIAGVGGSLLLVLSLRKRA